MSEEKGTARGVAYCMARALEQVRGTYIDATEECFPGVYSLGFWNDEPMYLNEHASWEYPGTWRPGPLARTDEEMITYLVAAGSAEMEKFTNADLLAPGMRRLFTIDAADYDPTWPVHVRPSARSIIVRDGLLAAVHSLKYDYYKFPGGGIHPAEDPVPAMIRETREEAGLLVDRASVREFGLVHRVQRAGRGAQIGDEVIFVQDNFYYLCEAPDLSEQELDAYEADEHFTLEWIKPEVMIEANRRPDHGPKDPVMLRREARVAAMLIAEGML